MAFTVIVRGTSNKGFTKRSPAEEMALRVRILRGRHVADVYQRALDEMGERARELGPVDMHVNALASYASNRARAYFVPPFCDGLDPRLAELVGDLTASTTRARYASANGAPLPSRMAQVSAEVLYYRIGCNYAATHIGWSEDSRRIYLTVVTPDDLECEYRSDDPLSPTVIRRRLPRKVDGDWVESFDEYDVTNAERPTYRVLVDGQDITSKVLGREYAGAGYWWRYNDGRPFIPIVVMGDPREPYVNIERCDASLTVNALWTHWKAGVLDAAYPSRHAIGLEDAGPDSNADTGQTGHMAGPEFVHRWRHFDPDKPGTLLQFGPGFDPLQIGKAIREYQFSIVSALGSSVSMESTGGEPTELERQATEEAARTFYTDCRGHDGLVLRRAAAVANRAAEMTEGMQPSGFIENAPAILYREEVAELFALPMSSGEDEDTNADEEGGDGGSGEE